MTSTYVPGVCNIGPAERRKRQYIGYAGLAMVVVFLVAIAVLDVPLWMRLLIAIPAGLSANGFLQSAMHFCVGFAMAGLYNMSATAVANETVMDAEQRRADQKKGLQIILYSALIAAGVVGIALLIP